VYYLVKKGLPFRKAHDAVGKLVESSLKTKKSIKKMKDVDLKKFSDKLKSSEIKKLLEPATSVKSRISVLRKKN